MRINRRTFLHYSTLVTSSLALSGLPLYAYNPKPGPAPGRGAPQLLRAVPSALRHPAAHEGRQGLRGQRRPGPSGDQGADLRAGIAHARAYPSPGPDQLSAEAGRRSGRGQVGADFLGSGPGRGGRQAGLLRDAHGPETLAFTHGTSRTHHWDSRRFYNLFGSPNVAGVNNVCMCPSYATEYRHLRRHGPGQRPQASAW
jgi:thiosulfate reductase / polysulfide reductase chain A